VPELRPHLVGAAGHEGARELAGRLLTLPTHHFVENRDCKKVAEILSKS